MNTVDKPVRHDLAPKITFENAESYFAWFREGSGWVGSITYHDGSIDVHPIIVVDVNDDGLVIADYYSDGGTHGETRKVLYNQINTFTVA